MWGRRSSFPVWAWERAWMAFRRSPVRSRSGPFINPGASPPDPLLALSLGASRLRSGGSLAALVRALQRTHIDDSVGRIYDATCAARGPDHEVQWPGVFVSHLSP